jgi:hypothetical protein
MLHLFNFLMLSKYYRFGWIDSIHTFNDQDKVLRFSRAKIVFFNQLLRLLNIKIRVWIDHSQSPYNFGTSSYNSKNLSTGLIHKFGDDSNSKAFHTDLTISRNYNNELKGFNILYQWTHFSPFFSDNLNFNYLHHNKVNNYFASMYVTDDLLIPSIDRQGYKFHRFLSYYYLNRINDSEFEQPWITNLDYYINRNILEEIVNLGFYSSIATHFGYPHTETIEKEYLLNPIVNQLIEFQESGKLLLVRTERLLNYARMEKYISWYYVQDEQSLKIIIRSIDDFHIGSFIPQLDDIRGLTFYVQNPFQTMFILVKKRLITNILS